MATIGEAASPGRVTSAYTRLGLRPGASVADIRRAYRRQVMRLHPDIAGNGHVTEFLAIKSAYESLLAQPRSAMPDAWRTSSPGGTVVYTPASRSRRRQRAGSALPEWRERAGAWSGGRWYWEGLGANAARRAERERAGS
jgi:DnaJ-class molecular chaperone